MPDKATRIGFVGFCKADIILYMTRILTCLGEKVAIIDRSGQHELALSVPAGLYSDDRLDYRGADIFLNCENTEINDLPMQNYSVLLTDYGVNQKAIEKIEGLHSLFIVTDMQRHHAVPLSSALSRIPFPLDAIRVIRDIVPGKIKPRYIDSLLQAAQSTNLLAKYEFPFHETEYAQRLVCQYDDIFQFSRISEVFKGMLLECITELFGFDKKSAAKALKKAQRGG